VTDRPLHPSEAALASVQDFFQAAASMSRDEVAALYREFRRAGRQPNLHTDREFLTAVTCGAWGPAHDGAARHIRGQARVVASQLVPWPRRATIAAALEAAALAVLSEADDRRPLPETLCDRLRAPYQRVHSDGAARVRTAVV